MGNAASIHPRELIIRFRRHLFQNRTLLSLVWICAFLAACLDFANLYLLQRLTDAALAQQNQIFWSFVRWALVAMTVNVVLSYSMRIAAASYKAFTIRDLRNKLISRIHKLPISFVETIHSGDFVSRLNNDIDRLAVIPQRISELVQQPTVFILGFIYLFAVSWKLLLLTSILIPVSAILHDKVVRPMQQHSKKTLEHLARANAFTQDAIHGLPIVKSFNLQRILSAKFERIARDVRDEGLAIDRRGALELAVFLMLRFIPQLTTPLYGGYLAFVGEITPGELIASVSVIAMLFIPVETALAWVRQFREVTPALDRIFEILDHPVEDPSPQPFDVRKSSPVLSLQSIFFQYDEGKPVLEDFNFNLQKGQIVALVGSSGCGKSTVIKLLCGFQRPQSGQVLIFGNDISASNLQDSRRQLALVAQETFLFPTTIFENIAIGKKDATREEVIRAAKAANAHDFILTQPQGYETNIGEWGHKLSGGERQRISIARAILKDAPILLLDEPTSALDSQSETAVMDALEYLMQDRSVIVIGHRLSTVKDVDEIIVLNEGRIEERGTHEQLMAYPSFYKRLYLNQTVEAVNE